MTPRPSTVLFTLLWLALTPLHAQDHVSQQLHALSALSARMQKPVIAQGACDVPPELIPLQPLFRRELCELAEEIAERHSKATVAELDIELEKLLRGAALIPKEDPDEGVSQTSADTMPSEYGRVYEVSFHAVEGWPDLVALTVMVGVNYGSDTALHLYRREGGHLHRLLSHEAPPYSLISGAFGGLKYAVSPRDPSGEWYVLTANCNAWPTSFWQSLRYSVLKMGPDSEHPKERKWTVGVYLGDDEIFKLHAGAREFMVSYAGGTFDSDTLVRTHVDRYQFRKDRWVRVAPWAVDPVGFLDEWREMPWSAAVGQVIAAARPAAQAFHRRWRTGEHSPSGEGHLEVAIRQTCPGKDRWLIELAPLEDSPSAKATFITLQRRSGDFVITHISPRRQPGCPGESTIDDFSSRGPLP